MTITVRLDPATEARLRQLARRQGRTHSEVVREAIRRLFLTEKDHDQEARPAEALAHLIGCVRGGPPELSSQTGQDFRQLLGRKRRQT